jgi:hypothetical protein
MSEPLTREQIQDAAKALGKQIQPAMKPDGLAEVNLVVTATGISITMRDAPPKNIEPEK